MTKYFIDVLGKELYAKIPTIETKDVKVGSTMYLDLFDDEQFDKNTIIKGVDRYRREFVSFKVSLKNNNNTEKKYILTMFNRYSDDKHCNVICVSHRSKTKDRLIENYIGTTRLNNDVSKKLKKLFDNYKNNKKENITIQDNLDKVTYEIGLY